MLFLRCLPNLDLQRQPSIDALVWSVTGPAEVVEGGSAAFTIAFAGYDLVAGESVAIDVSHALGTAEPGDFAATLAARLDAALTPGITRSGFRLTWDHTAAPELTFSMLLADDAIFEGDESFSISIANPSHGSILTGSAATTIDDDEAPPPAFILDTVPAGLPNAAGSIARVLTTTWAGALIRLRRVSDNAESDFGFVPGTGLLDTAAVAAWAAGSALRVTRVYDQSGNGRHATQATLALQPLFNAAGQNGRPTLDDDGATWLSATGIGITGNSEVTFMAAMAPSREAPPDGVSTLFAIGLGDGAFGDHSFDMGCDTFTADIFSAGGNFRASQTGGPVDTGFHLFTRAYNGATKRFRIDLAQKSTLNETHNLVTSTLWLGRWKGAAPSIKTRLGEYAVWGDDIGDAAIAAVEADMRTFWDTP